MPGAAVTQAARQVAGGSRSISSSTPGMSARRCSRACLTRRAQSSAFASRCRFERLQMRTTCSESRNRSWASRSSRACSTCCSGSGAAATMRRAPSSSRQRAAPDASPPKLLAQSPASRAVYLNLAAEPYLATLLGGANSATDLRGHGPGRMRRLLAGRELPVAPLYALSTGELAALGWLVESLSQARRSVAAGTTRARARFRRVPGRCAGASSESLRTSACRAMTASIAAIAKAR